MGGKECGRPELPSICPPTPFTPQHLPNPPQHPPPPENGTACPAQEWRGEGATGSSAGISVPAAFKERKVPEQCWLPPVTHQDSWPAPGVQLSGPSPLLIKRFPQTRRRVLLCMRHWLQLRRTLTLPSVPRVHFCLFLSLPHQALLWFFDDFPFV